MKNYIDKNNSLEKIKSGKEKIILELGCGNLRTIEHSITLDMVDLPTVDIICNLNEGFPFIPDDSVDEIHSSHFMEHIDDFGAMLKEIHRILKHGGMSKITVPHFSNPYFYSDYTHRNFFGLYSLSYFSKTLYFKRRVPTFYNDIDFRIVDVKYRFAANWKWKSGILKRFGKLINSNRTLMEYYEAHWCYKIPAREISYFIEKK